MPFSEKEAAFAGIRILLIFYLWGIVNLLSMCYSEEKAG